MDFTKEIIDLRFRYNPETGEIINKFLNKPVTYKDQDGYICCGCSLGNGKVGQMRGARLVWVMHYGDIPVGMIVDHKNRIRDDNRLENLRLATAKDNSVNSCRHCEAYTSKYKGVQLDKHGRWISTIQSNGVTTLLGKFDSEEAAAYSYNMAATEIHGDFALLNDVPEVDLWLHKSNKNRSLITESRRGLPTNLHWIGKDLAIRSDGKILARFKKDNIGDAIACAEEFNASGTISEFKSDITRFNKYGLPLNITPCSTGYRASFLHNYKRYHVGTFRTVYDAQKALIEKQKEVIDGC